MRDYRQEIFKNSKKNIIWLTLLYDHSSFEICLLDSIIAKSDECIPQKMMKVVLVALKPTLNCGGYEYKTIMIWNEYGI